jgi:hypothetical protein
MYECDEFICTQVVNLVQYTQKGSRYHVQHAALYSAKRECNVLRKKNMMNAHARCDWVVDAE